LCDLFSFYSCALFKTGSLSSIFPPPIQRQYTILVGRSNRSRTIENSALDAVSQQSAKWKRRRISTAVAIVFWLWFLGSLALVKRHPWVDTLWLALSLLLLVVGAVWASIQTFRHNHPRAGYLIGYRGMPRWMAVLFSDGVEPKCTASGQNQKSVVSELLGGPH
jgi:hypothetical protein